MQPIEYTYNVLNCRIVIETYIKLYMGTVCLLIAC